MIIIYSFFDFSLFIRDFSINKWSCSSWSARSDIIQINIKFSFWRTRLINFKRIMKTSLFICFLRCITLIYKRSGQGILLWPNLIFIFSSQIQLFHRFPNWGIGLGRWIIRRRNLSWILFSVSLCKVTQKGSALRLKSNLGMTIGNLFSVVWRRLFTGVRLWADLLAVSSYLFNWFFVWLSAQRLNKLFFSCHLSLKQLLLLTFITADHYRPTIYPFSNHLIGWKLHIALATLIHVLADAGDHYLRCQEFVVNGRARILWLLVLFNFTKMWAFLTIHRFNLSNKRLFLILFQMRTWTFLIGLLAIFVFLVLKILFQSFLNCRLVGIHLFVIIQRNLS